MFEYEGNRMALLCCSLLRQKRAPFTALYLYGPDGCGKTAMLNDLERGLYERNPDAVIRRTSAGSLNRADTDEVYDFFNTGVKADIVMVDDLHLVENQHVFSLISNIVPDMYIAGSKLVVTGKKKLDDYTLISPSLVSRMKWETCARITPPGRAECLAALKEAAEGLPAGDPAEFARISEVIIGAEGYNLGSILSTFRRIVVRAQMNNSPLTAEYAAGVIYDGAEIELLEA